MVTTGAALGFALLLAVVGYFLGRAVHAARADGVDWDWLKGIAMALMLFAAAKGQRRAAQADDEDWRVGG